MAAAARGRTLRRPNMLRLGLILALASLLLLLQYGLWIAADGLRQTQELRHAIAAQRSANVAMEKRNHALEAEVADLKTGLGAVESLARRELGMIGKGETFYQVVHAGADRNRAAPARKAPASPLPAPPTPSGDAGR